MPQQISFDTLPDQVGSRFGPSAPFTVSQDLIDAFARTTDDHQWIHVDVARAEREVGHTIAHGYLVLSLIPHFTAELLVIDGVGQGFNYGLDRVRFTAPVKAGTPLTATQTIVAVEEKSGGRLIRSEVAITAVGAERPACVAQILVLVMPGAGTL